MAPPQRARSSGRRKIGEKIKRLVWVRAGGCCELCGEYLLEGTITALPDTFGELAHIVGQSAEARSPRGQVDMPDAERDSAANLILVCPNAHDDIDRKGALDIATIERLRSRKREHESRIRRLVTMEADRKTAVLRVIGKVDDDAVQVPRSVAAEAAFDAGRIAYFPFSHDDQGFDIDLRGFPGEVADTDDYWRVATKKIDEVIDGKLTEAIDNDRIQHLSVFGIARLPLLVYLGSKLDDTYPVDVFQRRREDQRWTWADGPIVDFEVNRPDTIEAADAALVLNVSGTIDVSQLPDALRAMPLITLSPIGVEPHPDLVASRATLEAFELDVRRLLAQLEVPSKVVRRLHVVAAVPVSAAVTLGRAHDAPVHPELVVYHRTNGTYAPAVTVR